MTTHPALDEAIQMAQPWRPGWQGCCKGRAFQRQCSWNECYFSQGCSLPECLSSMALAPCRLEALDASTTEARAAQLLHGLGFTKAMQQKRTRDFSGGWRMRIALARALFVDPTFLILDGVLTFMGGLSSMSGPWKAQCMTGLPAWALPARALPASIKASPSLDIPFFR